MCKNIISAQNPLFIKKLEILAHVSLEALHRSRLKIRSAISLGVRGDSVVKCLTRNPGFLGSRRTGSSGFFVGVSLGKTLQEP